VTVEGERDAAQQGWDAEKEEVKQLREQLRAVQQRVVVAEASAVAAAIKATQEVDRWRRTAETRALCPVPEAYTYLPCGVYLERLMTREFYVGGEGRVECERRAAHYLGFAHFDVAEYTYRVGLKIWFPDGHVPFFARRDFYMAALIARRNYDFEDVGLMVTTSREWGGEMSRQRVGQIFQTWAPRLKLIGQLLATPKVTSQYMKNSVPDDYYDVGLELVAILGDGKDILTDTVRIQQLLNRLQQSSKMHHSAARGLSFSLVTGLYILVSDLFLSRASEMKLVEVMREQFDWLDAEWALLMDRGFSSMRAQLKNLNTVFTPAFLRPKDRTHFSPTEVDLSRIYARLRYTIEVGYSRVSAFQFLADRVPRRNFRFLNSIWWWAHGLANLRRPLRNPRGWDPDDPDRAAAGEGDV
jgi:hypothetical protein